MAYKLFALMTIASVLAQGQGAVTEEIRLEDEIVNHISNPLIGRVISIPHLMLDTLEACAVTLPSGLSYDIFPINNLPEEYKSMGTFSGCGVSFRNAPISMSGTYELSALTTHYDGRRSLQYRRFIVNFTPSGLWK